MNFDPGECSYWAFIDESGELGFRFERGSTEFLVMGAVIIPCWFKDAAPMFFEHAKALAKLPTLKDGVPRPMPKFGDAQERCRHYLSSLIPLYPFATVHVAAHKPTIAQTHMASNNDDLYAYLIKLTVERISWFVRDQNHVLDPGNKRCKLIFSENEALSYESIQSYLNLLRRGRGKYNCRIDWRYVSETDFDVHPHSAESELHIADVASGAMFSALDCSKKTLHKIRDDRFIRNMRDAICRTERQRYGLKIFPSEAIDPLTEQGVLDFMKLMA